AVDYHDPPGLDGDAGEAESDRRLDRPRSDGGHVDAEILLGLGTLAEHPHPPLPLDAARRFEHADAVEHRVGSLGRLERHDAAVDGDGGLAGVDDADGAGGAERGLHVAALRPPRPRLPERTGGHDEIGGNLVRPDDAHAALLEKADGAGEHIVVAADDDRQDVLEAAHGGKVKADALEIRTRADAADENEVAALARAQDLVEAAELPPIEELVRNGGVRLIGFASDAYDEDWAAGFVVCRRDIGRDRPAAGDDGER